jgi:hypothetical protein
MNDVKYNGNDSYHSGIPFSIAALNKLLHFIIEQVTVDGNLRVFFSGFFVIVLSKAFYFAGTVIVLRLEIKSNTQYYENKGKQFFHIPGFLKGV